MPNTQSEKKINQISELLTYVSEHPLAAYLYISKKSEQVTTLLQSADDFIELAAKSHDSAMCLLQMQSAKVVNLFLLEGGNRNILQLNELNKVDRFMAEIILVKSLELQIENLQSKKVSVTALTKDQQQDLIRGILVIADKAVFQTFRNELELLVMTKPKLVAKCFPALKYFVTFAQNDLDLAKQLFAKLPKKLAPLVDGADDSTLKAFRDLDADLLAQMQATCEQQSKAALNDSESHSSTSMITAAMAAAASTEETVKDQALPTIPEVEEFDVDSLIGEFEELGTDPVEATRSASPARQANRSLSF